MSNIAIEQVLALAPLGFIPIFYKFSPASKSTKVWTTIYLTIAATYIAFPDFIRPAFTSTKSYIYNEPLRAALVFLAIAIPVKYIQRKLRFARINAIKWKFGYTEDPKSWQDMTVEQAQEIERNMAEWEFPRLWQFGWISDFFRTSTDPGVARAINSSGHFINEDKRIEHQRMQATVHLMTGLAAYPVKSTNSSLVIARINEHHHRYGIKINSDDVLYLIIHFGLAPVAWINKFGYRKLEPFEVHAIWTLWRELGCRMGVKYIPETLEQAQQWRKNFENTHRWRDDNNEKMADAMLSQVLYPVPVFLRGFVSKAFASIIDWDIVYFVRWEKLNPSPMLREVIYDLFRVCGWLIREFGLPRLSPYVRSPAGPNEKGNVVFPHTPYDTMPYWQEATLWNLYGPRALFNRVILGLPAPGPEFGSDGVPFESMGAPHPHAKTQSNIEQKVRDMAATLEDAPYGYRPHVGWQANRLIGPVDGPEYGIDMNRYPEGTRTTPNNPIRFTREYERRAEESPSSSGRNSPSLDPSAKESARKDSFISSKAGNISGTLQTSPMISADA